MAFIAKFVSLAMNLKKKRKNSVNKNQYQIKAWWESLGTKLPSLANT